jgi:hypothetical protein
MCVENPSQSWHILKNSCHHHNEAISVGQRLPNRQKLHQQFSDNPYNKISSSFSSWRSTGAHLLTISATWVVSDGFDGNVGWRAEIEKF